MWGSAVLLGIPPSNWDAVSLSQLSQLPLVLLVPGFQHFAAVSSFCSLCPCGQIHLLSFSGVSQGREVNALFNLLSYPEPEMNTSYTASFMPSALAILLYFEKPDGKWTLDLSPILK